MPCIVDCIDNGNTF